MRPGQNKRMRGGRPNNNGGGNRKGPNPLTRSYESNGPDVKIRGNAHHVAEKYLQLARDAQSSGDPVAAESYLQHAEHYFRLIASAQAAQAGYARQPDAVDTEGEDEDDSGIPDRFASPQAAAPAPFVPQPAPQAYQGERQPYNGERQPYADRQNGQGDRPSYNGQNDRQPFNDRNAYGRQDRQDRSNLNRRPYGNGDGRPDDRQPGQVNGQGSGQQQDRPYSDRQSRRERFAQERLERQERQANGQGQDRGQDRPYGDRGYDRPRDGERYREAQPVEAVERAVDFGSGEQPRMDQPRVEQPRVEPMPERHVEPQPEIQQPAPERPPEPAPVATSMAEAQPEVAARRSEPPRRRERVERPVPSQTDDAPGLPAFITAPARPIQPTPSVAEPATAEPSLTTMTPFPGDNAEDAPKFPRRRRRTARAAAEGEGDAPAPAPEQPASDD